MSDPPARSPHAQTGSVRRHNRNCCPSVCARLKITLFAYGLLDASPARSPDLPDPPARSPHGKNGSARRSKNNCRPICFCAPLKMAVFPYGLFGTSPARSPDHARSACQTLPRQTGSGRRSGGVFCLVCFVNPWKLFNVPMVLLQTRPAGSSGCLLYTSPSPRDATLSRMPSSA